MNGNGYKIIWKYVKDIYIKSNLKISLSVFVLSAIKIFGVLIPPIYIVKIMDEAIPNYDGKNILLYIGIILFFTIFDAVLGVILRKLYNEMSKNTCIKYQRKCLEHLFRLDGKYLSNSRVGEKLVTMMNDVSQLKTLTSSAVFDFVLDSITAIVMLIFLARIKLDMLLMILCILPVIYLSQRYFQKKGREKAAKARDTQSSYADVLQTITTSTIPCILSNAKSYFFKKNDERIIESENYTNELNMVYAKNSGVLSFLSAMFIITVLGVGGFKVMRNTLSIGGLIAFNMYSQKLVVPILKVSNMIMTLQTVVVSMECLEAFMAEKEVEPRNFNPRVVMGKESSEISFENVSFSYEEKQILKDISLKFEKGCYNVVVGESGCGKSTLTMLLYRIWNVQDGLIKINGHDSKEFSVDNLRNSITIVGQDSFLFNDTIFNNIAMGSGFDKDRVEKCCRIACIHDYIMSLPEQYESLVGDSGVKLSGGEKQRICIARALLQDTPILVLDEATSALDQLTERKVLDNISEYIKDRIFILITHRLASIVDADNIVVLKGGEVEACGSHHELMRISPQYKTMFERKECIE